MRERIEIEGWAEIDYIDDNRTAMGIEISQDDEPIWIVIKYESPNDKQITHDNPLYDLVDKRCKVTIELI
jgi:hypothetical protein